MVTETDPGMDAPLDRSSPRCVYVHVPFCRHRCGYCNFSVIADRDDLVERFLSAIESEIRQATQTSHQPQQIETLFVGGGTPTHLPPATLERFLEMLRRRFRLSPQVEWSMEANPEDISGEKLDLMKRSGVNRLSLGVQSFNDKKLRLLERGHSGASAQEVIRQVAEVFENISIDLIFAAPGESVSQWESDLQIARSLPIRHVSTYALTFEKGTSFWTRRRRGDLSSIDESGELEMYDLARQMFAAVGLKHYEISNFARDGFQCRHNMAYWQGADWYAFGPGAAAFVDGVRSVNHRSTTTYLKRMEQGLSPVAESERVSAEQLAREAAAFGVRLIGGVDLETIRRRWGVDIATQCDTEIQRLLSLQLVDRDGDHIRLTERGIHFADTVASEFLG